MSKLSTEFLYQDIKKWQTKYIKVENLPFDFYLRYREILLLLKKSGKDKNSVLMFFLDFSEKHHDIKDFVDEIMDMIVGYCHKDLKVW